MIQIERQAGDRTQAIQAAIDRAAAQGGGRVILSAGEHVTASLELKSNVELFLEAGAVLRFTDAPDAYPVLRTRWEGFEQENYRALLYAKGAENIAITGLGTVEGQGARWWAAFREGSLRAARPCMIGFEDCVRVRIEGVKLHNSPAWTVHPLRCENVAIRDLTIVNPADSPNTDGIDPESCRNVRIAGCHIDVGDDCIAVKAGTEDAESPVPCENITITGCTMLHGHGGVVLGSEMSGGIRRVVVSSCVFDGVDRGIRIKSRRGRGGAVEDMLVQGVIMRDVLCPFVINLLYFCGKGGKDPIVSDPAAQAVDASTPAVRRIRLSDVEARGVRSAAACLYGLPESPLEDISLRGVSIELVRAEPDVPAMNSVQEPITLGGVFARHVRGLEMSGVRIVGCAGPEHHFTDVEL